MISNSYSACFFIDVWCCCMCNMGQPHASSPKTALSHKQNLPTIPHIHGLSIYWIVKCNSLIQLSTTIFLRLVFRSCNQRVASIICANIFSKSICREICGFHPVNAVSLLLLTAENGLRGELPISISIGGR